MLRGVLYRSVGPDGDVDDLLQEVFLGFFRNVGGLRDPAALKPFLIGIALRTARAALRKRRVRRFLRLTPTGEAPEIEAATADARTREALRRLFAVLDELGARDRLAFVLRHGEEYELTEVASALECSLATAKRCLARAEAHVLERARVDMFLAPYAREHEGGSP
jgi:RNA polymerase sigma-70 factor, ECF subfamily